VARLLGDQLEQHKAEVALFEDALGASSAAAAVQAAAFPSERMATTTFMMGVMMMESVHVIFDLSRYI
jgi:hypothetical protein